jgi:mono/diheme cytochrome c family protein
MRATILMTAVFLITATGALMAQEKGDIGKGRKIAQTHCSRCHVVGDFNPMGGISSTPSFQLLVKRRPDYRERFQTFFSRRPHPAFLSLKGVGRIRPDLPANAQPVELTEEDVKNMLAFIETLRPQGAQMKEAKKPLVLSPRPKPRVR